MAVDPKKPRRVLVVHGVETGTSAEQDQHVLIKDLLVDRLNGIPLSFETALFAYEDLNDKAVSAVEESLEWLKQALLRKIPLVELAEKAGSLATDIVADVLIARRDGEVAKEIRRGIKETIMQSYEEGCPLYLLAHSLGSIYAFDALQELMSTPGLFVRDQRRTWPVQGLVTIGSPLGLHLFGGGRKLHALGPGRKLFRWHNFWSRTDPVVSGSFYGKPIEGYRVLEQFQTGKPNEGWIVQDHVVDTGFAWMLAHVSYWRSPELGDALLHMIAT